MAEPVCRECFYGDYKLIVINRGSRGLWGMIFLRQRNRKGQIRESYRMIFNQRFPSSPDEAMSYIQTWSQQHRDGHLVEGDSLPWNLLGQVKLMAAGDTAMYWPARPSMM